MLSHVQLCNSTNCSMPGFPVLHNLLEFAQLMSIEMMMSSNYLILCCPLFFLPSIYQHQGLFNESALCIGWPKYWSFSFSISLCNEYSRMISFRMDLLDILAVQGTLKSPPTPQFKSIHSSGISFLHSPTPTSMHDHWKNHSLD